MREMRHKGQLSTSWWAVFLFACLAMALYIAFDLLDLDGSNLRQLGRGGAIAAESPSAETDRFLSSPRFSPGENQDPVAIPLKPFLGGEFLQRLPARSLEVAIARRSENRPRAQLSESRNYPPGSAECPAMDSTR